MRGALRVSALLLLFAACAPIHVATKLVRRRSPWPRRFLAAAARIVGARVTMTGGPALPHMMLVCNHVSWLDILCLGGTTGCTFVSKDQLGHGFIHWLADQNATVYVRRSHRKGAKDQALTIARALEGDKPVALFPEGTTGPGNHLLPFRSTLLEAANYAAKDVKIRPVAIDYGAAAEEVSWYQEPGMANVVRILGRRGTLDVVIRVLEPVGNSSGRKELAAVCREAIAHALGFKFANHSPIGEAE